MGCTQSEFVSLLTNTLNSTHINRYKNTEQAELTVNQLDSVKSTWKLIKNHKDFGLMIMERMFLKNSEIKHKWIFAKDLNTEEEIRKNLQTIYHAAKIMEMFNKLVNLYDLHKPNDFKEITHLGKNHFDYGVRPSDFEHFEECLIYCLEKEINDDKLFDIKTKTSWKKFFIKIASKLTEGIYLAEIDELNTINKCIK
ncbi:unnamed protein product [Brachionus calyciflorus]|uniref:Globin domain-containing protein n=1 Tax=Brachionus calyciflorus TaxID=104777 RepID=A0A814QXX2_9BILA|nr:unnamed protein product [Brachionus calyciflorus]